jgi:hypothetical protein
VAALANVKKTFASDWRFNIQRDCPGAVASQIYLRTLSLKPTTGSEVSAVAAKKKAKKAGKKKK